MLRASIKSILARKRRLLGTCSAVALGIAFLSGTLVLANTVSNGFGDLIAQANKGIDAVVRSSVEVGGGDLAERGLVDQSLAGTISRVDGVAAVAVRLESSGRIVGADGDPVGGSELTVAGNWITDERLNPYELAAGRAPAAPGEVVIDKSAADEGSLAIGDSTVVRLPQPIKVRIVGLASYAGADSQGAATYAAFSTDFAARVLLPRPGKASSIVAAAQPGITQEALVSRIAGVLPKGAEAISGAEHTSEQLDLIQGDDTEAFQQALLFFTAVALVVATFTIHNTFSILVAQRTRESALLRALGASRAQVLGSVATEALAVGLLASVIGIAAGWGLASVLLVGMNALDLHTPAAAPTLQAVTAFVSLAVGVVVTLVASIFPAVHASRVAPIAALRDVAVDRSAASRRRAVAGAIGTLGGLGLTILGGASESTVTVGLGALSSLAGLIVIGPVVAPRAAALLGAPLAARMGVSGVLAQRNASRNPRRTAGAAVSLMIGVMVVALFAVVASSLKQSITDAVATQFAGDLVIVGEGHGGLSTDLAPAIDRLPQVAAASPVSSAAVRINGTDAYVTAVDPATIEAVTDLDVQYGSVRDLRPDQIAVSAEYASTNKLALGAAVTILFPDGVTERPTVGAIFAGDAMVAGGGITLPRSAFLRHTSRPVDLNLMIKLAPGVSLEAGEAAVQRTADAFDAPDVQTNEEFTDTIAGEINALLTVVYVLLVVAILIAVMGITNTLTLSVHERTRELGVLRAVGQTRAQTRSMVRGEAVIVSLFGTVSGLALGIVVSKALVSALAGDGLGTFALPAVTLAVILGLSVVVGVLASVRPARRAARLDVLAAIATE